MPTLPHTLHPEEATGTNDAAVAVPDPTPPVGRPVPQTEGRRPRVVIIGGGFGGLQAARRLKRADVDVTLVDRRNFHLFQPLLYQVATGELSPANIAAPLRTVLRRQKNCRVILGEVTGIDLSDHRVDMSDASLTYDYLIVASGAKQHYFGNDHWSDLAPGLKTIENAVEIRRQVLGAFEAAERCENPEEVREILTFVIVGAGPTGCEMAGALSEIANHTLKNDFRTIDPTKASIILINSGELPLEMYGDPLPKRAAADLKDLGVTVINRTRVTDVQPDRVVTTNQDDQTTAEIRTRTVVWAAGVRASKLGAMVCQGAGIEPVRGGRVPVLADTSIAGHPNIFVIGDLAMFDHGDEGELPGLAPVATQMGTHAADAIRGDAKDKPRRAFEYFDKGSMAVIGRFSAVGEIGGWKVRGFVCWFLWLAVHLMYIAMFRNRILVLVQWGWTFLTHDRSSRLITDGPDSQNPSMERAAGWDKDPALPSIRKMAVGEA